MNLQAIEQEIQSIPGNGPMLEELYKLLESSEAIALVGAGASAGLWPLWIDKFSGKALLAGGDEDRLSQKLKRLLSFYESQLKNGQQELLGIISQFKRPVEIKSLVTFLSNMKSLTNTPLAQASA